MKAISIIIPVFNAEPYVRICIDSILNQTFSDFELILVDDGSTDGTCGILQDFENEDSRIIVLKQNNQYAGVARNKGLERAQGKYVIFLDADDFFESNMLETLYYTAEEYKAQIVKFYYYYYDNRTQKVVKTRKKIKKTELVSAKDLGQHIFGVCDAVPWDKMYLRSYLVETNIRFQNIKNNNDEYFTRMTAAKAERIVLLNKRLVYYRVNNSNSLQGNDKKDLECIAIAVTQLKKQLVHEHMLEGKLREAYLQYALYVINKNVDFMEPGSNESRKRLYEYLRNNAIPNIFDSIDELSHNSNIKRLLNSDNYEDYLIKEIQELKNNSVLKSSKSYRLGSVLLVIPKRLLFLIYWLKKVYMDLWS